MANEDFKNLTESELIRADHYAETGNWGALNAMQELSHQRERDNQNLLNAHRVRDGI